jgi:hypothetical protein
MPRFVVALCGIVLRRLPRISPSRQRPLWRRTDASATAGDLSASSQIVSSLQRWRVAPLAPQGIAAPFPHLIFDISAIVNEFAWRAV